MDQTRSRVRRWRLGEHGWDYSRCWGALMSKAWCAWVMGPGPWRCAVAFVRGGVEAKECEWDMVGEQKIQQAHFLYGA